MALANHSATSYISLLFVVGASSFLVFGIVEATIPDTALTLMRSSDAFRGAIIATSLGIAMLFCGIGALAISSLKLFRALRKAERETGVEELIRLHLFHSGIVICGFGSVLLALLLMANLK